MKGVVNRSELGGVW